MTNGQRIVSVCETALGPGPMGRDTRSDYYRSFVSCGLDADGGRALSTVATSCAIFVRAVHHWAGRPAKAPWRPGWPMFGGWLGDLSKTHVSWTRYVAGVSPRPGDVFFVELPKTHNNHVGVFLEEIAPGRWRTAEGGGSGDGGTRCAFGERTLGSRFDAWGRTLQGWWDAERLVLGAAPLMPELGPVLPSARRTLRRGSQGEDVRLVQRAVGASVDGDFGPRTEAAAKAWQTRHGLVADGVWGPVSWTTYDRGGQP